MTVRGQSSLGPRGSACVLPLLYEESLLEEIMAKRGPRQLVRMRSTESHHVYLTSKNRRNNDKRLELRKFDPVLRKHVVYRETR